VEVVTGLEPDMLVVAHPGEQVEDGRSVRSR
jgi:hypothetical protein